MEARMIQEGEIVVVHLSGRIDVETSQAFKEVLLKRLLNKPIVFDFRSLSFVGSSGIISFLDALQKFHAINSAGLRFSSVGIEFRRIFAATPLSDVLIFETAAAAADSFRNPQAAIAVPLLAQNPGPGNGFLTLNREADADGEIDESVIDPNIEV
ncbi:MAG: STAS domain-containing protein [Bdellovibrionota bacterium]